MNKKEIEERLNYANSNFIDAREIILEIIEKQQKELEQKEYILDKVTDKLKEVEKELKNDGYDYYSNEIKKILNIIEGEKK